MHYHCSISSQICVVCDIWMYYSDVHSGLNIYPHTLGPTSTNHTKKQHHYQSSTFSLWVTNSLFQYVGNWWNQPIMWRLPSHETVGTLEITHCSRLMREMAYLLFTELLKIIWNIYTEAKNSPNCFTDARKLDYIADKMTYSTFYRSVLTLAYSVRAYDFAMAELWNWPIKMETIVKHGTSWNWP